MAWTWHGVRIYTIDENDVNKPIVAKLQPLQGGTVIQTYGYENEVIKISCYVVGASNLATLKSDADVQPLVAQALVSDLGTVGNYYLTTLSSKRSHAIRQNLDTSQSNTAPVYQVDLELLKA
jgi:hypothetical protein